MLTLKNNQWSVFKALRNFFVPDLFRWHYYTNEYVLQIGLQDSAFYQSSVLQNYERC